MYMEKTNNQELVDYQLRLRQPKTDSPIWEKKCLTIEEAAAYSGIGTDRI